MPLSQAAEAVDYDPYAPEVMANPLPYYRRLRRDHPVLYLEKYDAYFLSRFQDVYDFLSVADGTFVSSEGARPTPEVMLAPQGERIRDASTNPLAPHAFHGSPVYETLRQAHRKPLTPGAVRRLAAFIREQANARLDILLPRGRFDLTQHYGGIVAAAVQCHLFGIPLTEAKYVLDTINAQSLTNPLDGTFDAQAKYDRLCEIVQPGIMARRKAGPDGSWPMVDGMFDVEIDGRRLTDREIAETVGVVLLGGTETVPKVVSHGLWELQKRPNQMAAVRADLATNVPAALKEMIRLCAPAQWFIRTVRKPTVLAGVEMSVGQRVVYLIPSAARDEREYGEDAEEFRWDRPISRWVSFGLGQHFCLGYHLALLEGAILVEEFLKRVPDFDVLEHEAVRRPSSFQWGYNELPVVVPGDNAYHARTKGGVTTR